MTMRRSKEEPMNKVRRKALDEVISKIEEAKELLESLRAEEEEYRDNMPENLQGSEKYEAADIAVDNMSSAMDALDEAISSIESAQE